jgi:hypothetical protein
MEPSAWMETERGKSRTVALDSPSISQQPQVALVNRAEQKRPGKSKKKNRSIIGELEE